MEQDIFKEYNEEIQMQKEIIEAAKKCKKSLKLKINEINATDDLSSFRCETHDPHAARETGLQNVEQFEMKEADQFDFHSLTSEQRAVEDKNPRFIANIENQEDDLTRSIQVFNKANGQEIEVREETISINKFDETSENSSKDSSEPIKVSSSSNELKLVHESDEDSKEHTDVRIELRDQREVEVRDAGFDHSKAKGELMIDVKKVKKSYGSKEVLKGIDLQIYEGERVALFGANGAGKSTLTEIICQIKQPTSGEVHYSFGNSKKEISQNIGVQFQETSYPFYYRVIDVIKFFSEATKRFLTNDEIKTMLEQFQLDGLEKRRAENLSGGQKQRLNILLAVLNNPKLLLLDEVSTGLDVESRTKVKKFIKDYLNETNSTLILVSHNPDEIEYLVDRLVVIYDGKVAEDYTISDIKRNYETLDGYIDYLFLERFKQ